MKDYYISCGVCGIISGKIHGFSKACKKRTDHRILIHNDKEYEYLAICDWKS